MSSPTHFKINLFHQAEGSGGSAPSSEANDNPDAIVAALACAIEAKDFRLRRHSDRVAGYALQIAEMMNLSPEDRTTLQRGSILHDIGNIGIADSILLKPGGLSDWEFEEVRMHPIIGETICRSLGSLAPVIPLIRSHHEKLDGSGYPDALRGDAIPVLVRLVSVADVYDTLRSDRSYRGAFGHNDAVDILRKEAERGWWQTDIVEMLAGITAPQADFSPV